MDKSVFNYYMRNKIVQRVVIFADVFNLNIEGWKPANSGLHPERLYFYSGDLLTGYIDMEIKRDGINYLNSLLPFTFFTPLGKVVGTYFVNYNTFEYSLSTRQKGFKEIEGSFKICEEPNKNYKLSSRTCLVTSDDTKMKLIFNALESNYVLELVKEKGEEVEAVNLYYGGDYVSIEHYEQSDFSEKKCHAKITAELAGRKPFSIVDFNFFEDLSYKIALDIPREGWSLVPYIRKIDLIGYRVIADEIDIGDPRMFTFIDEIKESTILLANGVAPISLYDKIARLCFQSDDNFKSDFSRAGEVSTALGRNIVLKKMDKDN